VGRPGGEVVTAQEAGMSPADIDAEIARLEALRDRPARRAELEAQPTAADAHPLARYGLSEQQRTALMRAGFTSPGRIEAATDEEILATEGIGEGTLKRLRG